MTAPPFTLLVVSHTHWDREWYHTAARFRQRLVPLVDELLDVPPTAGTSFLLDGQAVLLDDYLDVRRDRAAALGALLADGRLEAGPWYVLADELIPGGEALVRNLLLGRDTVRRLGGDPPSVLYCPDSFGHPAALPELARGFGCDLVVLWRGYGGARWPSGDTVRWRGPSGAEVTLHHLPPDGYEFGSSLPHEAPSLAARWAYIESVQRPRATTGVALLLNGADHHARQRDLSVALAGLASAAGDAARVRPTSLRAGAAVIAEAASRGTLPVVQGELRDSYGYTWTLGGTLATRAAQKRRNALAERGLARDVEPWVALAPAGGDPGTRALLDAAWRTLLRAHPHDTLCGTSIDAVADAFDDRVRSAAAQGAGLRDDALMRLLGHDPERARAAAHDWRPALVLRNAAARPRSGVAEVRLAVTVADVAVGPGSASRQGGARDVGDAWLNVGRAQPTGMLSRAVALTESSRAYPDADLVNEIQAVVWSGPMAGYTVQSRPSPEVIPGDLHPVTVTPSAIDNGLLRVEVDERGVARLTDLGTGHVVPGLLSFELRRDAGDLYTPAPREHLPPPRFARCRLRHAGPLRGELALSYLDLDEASHLEVRLQLDAGLAALRIHLHGHNAREDVRLRIGIDTALGDEATTVADAAFHPQLRTPLVIGEQDAAMEQVVHTAPLHRYVSRFAPLGGATIFSDGLAEYESLDEGAVAVTLLRAVGELSRHDLPERPGHAGWPASTPKAQSQGTWDAMLGVALHGPDSDDQREAVERLADDILLPITGETLRSNLGGDRSAGGIELEGDGLAFSAAMPARREGWIVLRCVNRRATAARGRWRLGAAVAEAATARLDETPGQSLTVGGRDIPFVAAPMEIVTILARLA